ncbi:hypothetical protein [Labilibaculum euxinus]
MNLDLREILSKHKLNEILNLNSIEFNSFVAYIEHEESYTNCQKITSRLDIFFFLVKVLIGIIVSNFICFFKYKKKNNEFNENIFVTHYSHYIKASVIPKILSKDKTSILYTPTMHVHEIRKHYNHFVNDKNVHFDTFGIKVFFNFFSTFKLISFFSNLLKDSNDKFGFLLTTIVKYRLFSLYADQLVENNTISRKWIFDNDKAPSFSPLVKKLNSLDICTINLQHGSFFDGNKFYLPSISKYVFCCSEREKALFVDSGLAPSQVLIVGAPFQSFIDILNYEKYKINDKSYDLLVLLTETQTLKSYTRQLRLLKVLELSRLKTLIRFRPASKNADYAKLKSSIPANCDLSDEMSLDVDINRSVKIISFSLDALFVCKRYNKDICLICSTKIREQLTSSGDFVVYGDHQDIDLDSFFMDINSDHEDDNFGFNFGVTDFNQVKKNFMKALNFVK